MGSLRLEVLKLALKAIEPFQDEILRYQTIRHIFREFYTKFFPHKWILTEVEGVKIFINTVDVGFLKSFILEKKYEEGTVKVFKSILRKGMIVVDVGACTGFYSLIASKIIGKDGKVFAFEPHPINYIYLKESIEANRFNNIIPINKAILDRKGIIKLFYSKDNIADHSIVITENREYIEVEGISLDDFCKENNIVPDVIKMDIEGAELLALKGMRRTIKRCDSLKMFIEFRYNKEELYEFLSKYFDNIFRITKDGRLVPFDDSKRGNFEPNIYCVRGLI